MDALQSSVVTIKGQIVIPSKIRQRFRIKPGTRVFFLEQGNEVVLKPVTNNYIESLCGSVKTKGKGLKILLEARRKERQL